MKQVFQILLIFSLILIAAKITAQSFVLSSENKKALKSYHEAEVAYKSFEYSVALENLEKAVSKDGEFIEAWLLLGDVYTELRQPEDAILAFKKAIQIDSTFFPRTFFFIGNIAYDMGEYSLSSDYFRRYLQFRDEQEITRFLAQKRLKRSELADSLVLNPVNVSPMNMGNSVNTESDEFINFVNETFSELVITRKVETGNDNEGRKLYTEYFFESKAGISGWVLPEVITFKWLEGLNIGGMNLSVDGRKMYFTGCDWPEGFGSCDLYVSNRTGKLWENPVNLGSTINSQSWDSQPVISSDGKQIFFGSKRSGGKGGSDIWMTIKLENGKWSPPINLGDSINTGGNEMAPFLHADGKTLYFSSDGHNGLGGADLFISRKDNLGRWSKAKNLGYPINTRYNEINLFMCLNGEYAYLSSDRTGGEGGFDVYQMKTVNEIKPEPVYFVKGIVLDKNTGKPLKASVELTNLMNGLLANNTNSDVKTGEFLMVLHRNIDYAFNISKPDYLLYSEHFNFIEKEDALSVEKVFEIEPIAKGNRFILENVFFGFDQSELNPKSHAELDKLFQLLKENLQISILVGGHTDNIGEEEYNLRLSENRAKVVLQYLVEKGISPERIKYKGYGSAKPISDNNTDEGRAKNRRTEITIL